MSVHKNMRCEVTDPKAFGRVAVLMGGQSSERDVSLDSGGAVLAALRSADVNAEAFDPAEKDIVELRSEGFDRAWIALHGSGGEDGKVQGALEWLGIPFTGSGVLASALAMDKMRAKQVFQSIGIPTPEFDVARSRIEGRQVAGELGYPLIIKPNSEGSSVGMSKVFDENDLDEALDLALGYSEWIIIERCIAGDELTVSVLQGEPLASIRIETPRVFYDYRAKYESDRTEYHCPGARTEPLEKLLRQLAMRAFTALACEGWGRVDFMVDADNRPYVLEVNTVPGMTSHSLVPMAAAQQGIDFAGLCWRILETSIESEEVARGA